jgi:NAD(P)-dependent dehydrogenase (short-subunit alcohol dehydrogenase family)
MNAKNNRSAAITGAGSGLGRDIALGLAAKGYQVFGTAITTAEIAVLRETSAGKVNLRVCDITDEKSVQSWVRGVSNVLGESGLNLLVSNAGILTPGPLEILPLAAVKHEFDVNVFGSLAVINAFLPALRKARGRIVQIGAMTGRFPIPFNGPSSASKATFEAFADIYRAELKPFGVDFVVAQAGNLLTGGPAKTAAAMKRVSDSMTPDQRGLYGEAFDTFAAALNKMQGSGLPSIDAAHLVIEIAERTPAPIRVPVGADAERILRLVREQSDADLDALRLQIIGLS